MIEIKPPNEFTHVEGKKVFIAGAIDMGSAEDWQHKLATELKNTNLVLLNPRRTDWDSTWEQSIDNPKFAEQVNWELNGLETSDFVVFYFSPTSKSPITMLELGLMIERKPLRILVCCPEGFYRKGNIDIVCSRYGIPMVNSLDELISELRIYDLISSS